MPKRHYFDLTARHFHMGHPWSVQHHNGHSELMAYSENTHDFQKILTVHKTSDYSAKQIADFLLNIMNETIPHESVLLNAMHTMQVFLVETDFDEKIEKPVTDLIDRIKRTYEIQ